MNASVVQILAMCKCAEESVQNEALAQLGMLFERNAYPERKEEIWEMILPQDLLEVPLPKAEIDEILRAVIAMAVSKELPRSTELCLMGIIAHNSTEENAEVLLNCFSEFADNFSEQEAFSFLASFTHFLFGVHNMEHFQALLAKHGTVRLLREYQINQSVRLRESVYRILNRLSR